MAIRPKSYQMDNHGFSRSLIALLDLQCFWLGVSRAAAEGVILGQQIDLLGETCATCSTNKNGDGCRTKTWKRRYHKQDLMGPHETSATSSWMCSVVCPMCC